MPRGKKLPLLPDYLNSPSWKELYSGLQGNPIVFIFTNGQQAVQRVIVREGNLDGGVVKAVEEMDKEIGQKVKFPESAEKAVEKLYVDIEKGESALPENSNAGIIVGTEQVVVSEPPKEESNVAVGKWVEFKFRGKTEKGEIVSISPDETQFEIKLEDGYEVKAKDTDLEALIPAPK